MTAKVELIEVDRRRLRFWVEGYDEKELISKGTHERFVIDRGRFDERLEEKRKALDL